MIYSGFSSCGSSLPSIQALTVCVKKFRQTICQFIDVTSNGYNELVSGDLKADDLVSTGIDSPALTRLRLISRSSHSNYRIFLGNQTNCRFPLFTYVTMPRIYISQMLIYS